MSFTQKQKEVLKIAKEKGFITHGDMTAIFSSPISRKANLERFLAMGIFTVAPSGNAFQLDSKKLNEIESK